MHDIARTGTLHVSLAGNPNVGKSSLFNHLTGAHQHVGNWPGKTIERRSGTCRRHGAALTIVDLPGTYSLASSSPEELVAEAALVDDDTDVVAVVLDSTNLERNLYLAAQLAELGRALVLALNMADVADAEGTQIDDDTLARSLGAPVVRTVGRTGRGIDELVDAIVERRHRRDPLRLDYGEVVESELAPLEQALARMPIEHPIVSRWTAIRLLEEAPASSAAVAATPGGEAIVAAAQDAAARVRRATGEEPALLIADRRFEWAHRIAAAAVDRDSIQRPVTERLDDVLTSRWLGIPIFLALMWVVFTLVTDVAGPLVDWTSAVVDGPVSDAVGAVLDGAGLDGTWFDAFAIDGVLGGVGTVVVFVPVLAVLYLALGVLEDSGYMARAAFLVDRFLRPIGLTGKSFLPLLLGFGCNVAGVYATRVLDRRRDRILTALLMPFVTCAARLPIYVLLAAAFFPSARGTVVFALYVASIGAVLAVGAVLDRVVLRAERGRSFVLELPAFRRPSIGILARYVWLRVRAFLTRAGTVILGGAVVVWTLLAVPVSGDGTFADTELQASAFASVARTASPALRPAGLGTWEVTGTLVSGFVAKEVVVATLDQVYGDGPANDDDLAAPLRTGFDDSSGGHGALAAVAFLTFVLLYVPCMATVAAIAHELGTRWAALSVVINLTTAWIAAVAVFQVGRALGIG